MYAHLCVSADNSRKFVSFSSFKSEVAMATKKKGEVCFSITRCLYHLYLCIVVISCIYVQKYQIECCFADCI